MNKIFRLLFALIALLISVTTMNCYSQNISKKIDSLLKVYDSFDEINGNVLVAEGNNILYKNSFGKANFEWNIANVIDTKFDIASLSKPITAVIIFQLIEAEQLNLNGKVSDYLPDYPKDKGSKITIEQLLTHTSGLTDSRFIKNFDDEIGVQNKPHSQFINIFKDEGLLFEPGTKWSYSNFGYNLLTYIAEKIYAKPFNKIIEEKIFKPCKMVNSTTLQNCFSIPYMANHYEIRFSDISKGKYYDASSCFGSSGIITTIGDYFLFYRFLISGKLLSTKYLDLLLKPYTKLSGETTGYSFWFDRLALSKPDTATIIRSAGSMYGWNSVIYFNPKDEKFIAMFLNVKNPKLFEIADNVTNVLYNLPFEYPKDNYAHLLFQDIQNIGIDKAIIHYRELKNKKCCNERFRDLNRLGYFFLEKDNYDMAMKVFMLNIENFPENADGYDSLGEAYMKFGNKDLAIKNYQKSVELDPKNDNAISMLKKLR